MRLLQQVVLAALVMAAVSGCSPSGNLSEEISDPANGRKITADAYLFDARLFQRGKPTSVRLEFYHTDSLLGISGRGYLGKGALKGWATADSLVVYFPSTNEYVRSSLADILNSADDCALADGEINAIMLLNIFPDVLLSGTDYIVETNIESERPDFKIITPLCGWELRLEYSEQAERYYLYNIEFDDGKDVQLKAKRRTLKEDAEVPLSRFVLSIPPDAHRIIP